MKRLVLSSTIALIAGLFAASLAMGAWPASGEPREVVKEHHELAAQNLDKNQIREMQKLLKEKGFNPGAQDGTIGPNTRQALRQFQQSQGFAASGKPDVQTLKALAPSAREQEFFGLSPQYGPQGAEKQEAEKTGSTQPEGVKTPGEVGVPTASGETRQVQKEQHELTVENLNRNQIREMQKLLKEQGFNPGAQDGIIGTNTRQALRRFQKSQGIAATGKADVQTLKALAPSAKEQEFFGLSPKYGPQEMGPLPATAPQ